MKKIIFINVIFTFMSTSGWAGPWPQSKGVGYFKLSEWWITFDQHFTDEGLLDPNSTTGIYNTSFYTEYGVTDRMTAIINANILSRNVVNSQISGTTGAVIAAGDIYNGIGDTDIGIKYGLTTQGAKFPVSISLILGIPSGATLKGVLGNLATGDGEFNQLVQLDAGTGFRLGSLNAYTSIYGGINHRTKGFSEEIRLGGEFGLGFFNSRLWLSTKLNIIESLKNGDTSENDASTSIFANNTEFTSFALEVNYYVTQRAGVSVNFASAFRGEIIAAAPSYSFGFFYDMSK